MVDINSKELKDFVSSAVNSIESGLKDQKYMVAGAIQFELAVVKVKRKGAGIRIYVVDASAKYGTEVVSKIKFQTVPSQSRFGRALR